MMNQLASFPGLHAQLLAWRTGNEAKNQWSIRIHYSNVYIHCSTLLGNESMECIHCVTKASGQSIFTAQPPSHQVQLRLCDSHNSMGGMHCLTL